MRVFYPRLSRTEAIERLRSRIPGLLGALPVRRVTLFGSYAADRFTRGSDIDVLVIYDGPPRDDAFRAVVQALAIPGVEPHVYTDSEAQAVAPTLERMTSGGVPIYERDTA